MSAKSLGGAFAGSLLMATALTPLRAADMSNERALNPQREPQNWISRVHRSSGRQLHCP